MASFIVLGKFTQQGVANIKDSPKRVEDFRRLCGTMNAEMKSYHLTMGRYDFVVMVEAPDAQTMAKLILTTASKGSVSTECLTAINEQDYSKLVAELS